MCFSFQHMAVFSFSSTVKKILEHRDNEALRYTEEINSQEDKDAAL